MSEFLPPHGLQPIRLLHPWDFPGKSTGVDCHFLLQGIFPTQGLNPSLPHCRQRLLLSEPPEKSLYFIDDAKSFDCVDHNKLWKILKEIGIPDHLTCLLRNLYAGQEARIRTEYGTIDWFQIGKGVCQGCILSPCLFNLYDVCRVHHAKCQVG